MAAMADFVGTDFILSFPAGSASSTLQGSFFSIDDDAPEPDELFAVTMEIFSGSGVIGNPGQAFITIAASDDAFGVIGFNVVRT